MPIVYGDPIIETEGLYKGCVTSTFEWVGGCTFKIPDAIEWDPMHDERYAADPPPWITDYEDRVEKLANGKEFLIDFNNRVVHFDEPVDPLIYKLTVWIPWKDGVGRY